jgi:hypothetical protein
MKFIGTLIAGIGFVVILTAKRAKPSQGILGWTALFAGLAIAANS